MSLPRTSPHSVSSPIPIPSRRTSAQQSRSTSSAQLSSASSISAHAYSPKAHFKSLNDNAKATVAKVLYSMTSGSDFNFSCGNNLSEESSSFLINAGVNRMTKDEATDFFFELTASESLAETRSEYDKLDKSIQESVLVVLKLMSEGESFADSCKSINKLPSSMYEYLCYITAHQFDPEMADTIQQHLRPQS